MKTNKSRFTEDDIRRNLPPDVFSLLHDLAYLNPHRSSLRQSVISFINGARSLLRKNSDGDIDAQLHNRELFSIDRCIDKLCELCENGIKAERVEYGILDTPRRIVHYINLRDEAIVRDCPAILLHVYRERIESADRISNARKTVLAPEKLLFDADKLREIFKSAPLLYPDDEGRN